MTDVMQGAVRLGPFVQRRVRIAIALRRFFHPDWRSLLFGYLGYRIVDKALIGEMVAKKYGKRYRFATLSDLFPDAELLEVVVDGNNRRCTNFYFYHLWVTKADMKKDELWFEGEGDVREEFIRTCSISIMLQRFELLPARGNFSFGVLLVEIPERK